MPRRVLSPNSAELLTNWLEPPQRGAIRYGTQTSNYSAIVVLAAILFWASGGLLGATFISEGIYLLR